MSLQPKRPLLSKGRPIQSLFSDQYKDLLSIDFQLPSNASQSELQKLKDQVIHLCDLDVTELEEFYHNQMEKVDALLAEL